jgi:hypothetical protein
MQKAVDCAAGICCLAFMFSSDVTFDEGEYNALYIYADREQVHGE